jgi:hypothetical protein
VLSRSLSLIAAALLALTSCLAAGVARAANGVGAIEPSDAAVQELGRSARGVVHAFEQNDYSVRELTYYAHYMLAMGQEPAKAEAAIHLAFLVQDMDQNSPDFGTFPWDIEGLNHLDPNSVEFTLESLGPILLRYANKLSDRIKHDATDHVRAGLAAVRRHKVPVTYTNMFLMKMENLLLLGEWSGDQQTVAQAGEMLDQWLAQCRAYGIHEFASPTYTGVQLNSLGNAYRCAGRAELKPKLKQGLDLLYAHMLASYFAGHEELAGAQSRTYDFLYGTGGIDQYYYLFGLRGSAPPAARSFSAGICGAYVNRIEAGGYQPSDDLLALARLPQRTILETWGDRAGEDRCTFITPDFSAGSTSAWYGAQEQQIAVQLAEAQPMASTSLLPAISVCGDALDAPYGKVRHKDRTGHEKPNHLRNASAVVQHEGMILALMDLSPGVSGEAMASVATNVVLPLRAEQIVLDGRAIELPADVRQALANRASDGETDAPVESTPGKDWSTPATPGSVVGVRQRNAGVAIRIFAADGLGDQQQPALAIKADGARWGAGRLIAYHYRGEPRTFDRSAIRGGVRAGVLIVAGRCESDNQFNAMMNQVRSAKLNDTDSKDDAWHVTAEVGGHTLESELSFKTGRPTLRRVDGQDYRPAVFSVNGRDLAAELLGQ